MISWYDPKNNCLIINIFNKDYKRQIYFPFFEVILLNKFYYKLHLL